MMIAHALIVLGVLLSSFCVQEFVKIARLRLQMGRIGVPPNAEMQARAEGKDPSSVAAEVRVGVRFFLLADGWTARFDRQGVLVGLGNR